MAMYAPNQPTLETLRAEHPLGLAAETGVEIARHDIDSVLSGERNGLIAVLGPCAMTADRLTIDQEGTLLEAVSSTTPGLVAVHRMPPWKPRTNPADWHGLESDPKTVQTAYQTVVERATASKNVAIELGHAEHLDRYGRALTVGWVGSRNTDKSEVTLDILSKAATNEHSSLPLGIKNGMDGGIDTALEHLSIAEKLRQEHDGSASAVLVYRGGANAKDASSWVRNYRKALELTNGRLIVDTAHGGEMAFDPDGNYKKSVAGQIACMQEVIKIGEDHGELPTGIMIEASSAESPTDPVMPFAVALSGAKRLHELKMNHVR